MARAALLRNQLCCARFLLAGLQPPQELTDEVAELGADLAVLQDVRERN